MLIRIRLFGYFFLRLTSSVRNLERASAHKHCGSVSGSMSALSPPFVSLLCASSEKSLMIRTLWVTTAPRGNTRSPGISCAASFRITMHFWRRTSSLSFSQIAGKCSEALRWLPYLSARLKSAPAGANVTGTPLVTIVIRSLMAPKPLRSPKYRRMFVASIGGATKAPPRALATSPTAPRHCLVRVVQISANLYITTCRPRGSESTVSRFFVSACHSFTRDAARDRLSDAPSGSREHADPLPVRESTGPGVYWATHGQRGSVWPCSAGPRLGPAECV